MPASGDVSCFIKALTPRAFRDEPGLARLP